MWTRRSLLQSMLAAAACGARHVQPDYNVLLIQSDEHNHRFLSCAGHPVVQTPNLDRLAAGGMRFTAAHAASPLCAPSRQSLMTGLYPQEHGVVGNAAALPLEHEGLASAFTAAGWQTGLYGKVHTNNPAHHLGFQTFETLDTPGFVAQVKARRAAARPRADPRDQRLFDQLPPGELWGRPLEGTDTDTGGPVTKGAVQFLERHGQQRFFLTASYTDPHHPWELPEEWYYRYDPDDMPAPAAGPEALSPRARRIWTDNGWGRVSEAQRRLMLARYAGAVSYMDHQVGRLLDALDRLGLAERTLVVYTTDHGELGGEKGLWLKSVMYDDAIRVPLIMRAPGLVPAGATSDALVSQVSLLPTVAEALGLGAALPPRARGRALPGLLAEPGFVGPRLAFAALPTRSGEKGQFMARTSRYKLIRWRDRVSVDELYDLDADPQETEDLAGDPGHAEVLADLSGALEGWQAGLAGNPWPAGRVARGQEEAVARVGG